LDRATPSDCGRCRADHKAKGFTFDGEAVVLGPDGLSRFEELSRREAADTAIVYAFDLVEYHGEDMRKGWGVPG
jgi:ATP-dependent DNA ligase